MRQPVPHTENPSFAERDYLRPDEANRLINAVKNDRHALRNKVLLRLMYRHGLRVAEARGAKWDHFDLEPGSREKTFHVHRVKGSKDSIHTLDRDEVTDLRKLKDQANGSLYVFVSQHGKPISAAMIALIVQHAGIAADLSTYVHPHMLRHSAGYMLANEGVGLREIQAHLGHANVQNTVRYTQLSAKRLASVRVR